MTENLPETTVLLDAEQLHKRIEELARQISEHYKGAPVHCVCVLDNAFMFMADLVRALDIPVTCHFVKPRLTQTTTDTGTNLEIFFSPEIDVRGEQVLLVECVIQSGITAEFLMRNLAARGAACVKLVALMDKQSARRVSLQPDFFGFLVGDEYLVGFGLGAPQLGRNLPYIATVNRQAVAAG
jgi:hypoxanthine phosphoribosyltransferase